MTDRFVQPMTPAEQSRWRELQAMPPGQPISQEQIDAMAARREWARQQAGVSTPSPGLLTGPIQGVGDPDIEAALDQILGPAGGGAPAAPEAPAADQPMPWWQPDPRTNGPPGWVNAVNETVGPRVRAIGQGVTLGGGDELRGLGEALMSSEPGGFWENFNRGRDEHNTQLDAFRQSNPIEATALEIGGSVLPSVMVPGATWVRGAPVAGNIARTALAGAGLGGASAALNDQDIPTGAAIGAVTGAGIPAAGAALMRGVRGAARAVGGLVNRGAVPTTDALKDISQTAFRTADQTGAVIAPNVVQSAGNVLDSVLQGANLDAAVHPATARALATIQSRLADATQRGGLRFEDISNLRTMVTDAVAAAEGPDRRVATILSREFNRFLDGLTPQDIVSGGNINDAMAAYRQGQATWGRYLRSQELDEMMRVAHATPAGYEQGLINEFRKLYRDQDRWARYTPEEQEAIRQVISGGPIGSVLRLFGKAAPTGIVSAGGGAGIGLAVGGPAGAIAVPAAGMASKLTADALTRGSANRVGTLVRGGPAPNVISPAIQDAINQFTSAAGRTGAGNADDLLGVVNAGMRDRALIDALTNFPGVPLRGVQSVPFFQ